MTKKIIPSNPKSIKNCSIEWCENKHYANGFCSKHRARWKRHGNPFTLKQMPRKENCEVVNCDRKTFASNLCRIHYYRLNTYGNFETVKRHKHTEETFWANKIITKSGCWEWQGYLDKADYGVCHIKVLGVLLNRAHRISWALINKKLPVDMILHSCDNPKCYNPEHLREGTVLDNARDRKARNRRIYKKKEVILK